MKIDSNTPIWQLTVANLMEILKEVRQAQPVIQQPEKRFKHGLKGIAQVIKCSFQILFLQHEMINITILRIPDGVGLNKLPSAFTHEIECINH